MPNSRNDGGNHGWDEPDAQDGDADPDAANYADLDTQPDESQPEAADNERSRTAASGWQFAEVLRIERQR